jgi:hypothetical protein
MAAPVPLLVSPFEQSPIAILRTVANWYVNLASGNDASDGQDPARPFRTLEKMAQTLCPNGAQFRLTQNVTVNVQDTVAQTYGSTFWNIDRNGFTFTLLGTVSASAAILLATVTNTNAATATRGRLTTATAGAFTGAALQRLRATTGTHAGAISFCNGTTSGTDVFCQEWLTAAGAVTTVAAGDNIVRDTLLTSVGQLDVLLAGLGSFVVQDMITVGGIACYGANFSTATVGSPLFYGCELGPAAGGAGTGFYVGSMAWRSCRVTNVNATHFQGSLSKNGCSLQAPLALTLGSVTTVKAGCAVDLSRGWVLTQLSNLTFAANCEFENGTSGSAFVVGEGCSVECSSGLQLRLWGVAGAYSTPISITNAGRFDQNQFVVSIPGNTALTNRAVAANVGAAVAGLLLAYDELPIVSGSASYGVNFQNWIKARFVLEAQTAAIATNAFFPAAQPIPPKGLYRVTMHLVNNAGTSGNLVLTVTGADRIGTYSQTATLAILGTSRLDTSLQVKTDGVNPFNWGLALDTVVGTPGYDIELVAERIG